MIEQSVVENIIETSNSRIVDIISDFVSLKRRGANYVGCCPFHNEKTGSFSVSAAKGIFKCFGCGKSGNAVKFMMEHEHMTFTEAIHYLGQKVGIEVKEIQLSPEMEQAKSRRESLLAVCEFAQNTFTNNLWNTPEGISVGLPYFRGERGFRDDIIRKFELGYSLEKRDSFTQLALQHGYKSEFLKEASLSIFSENGYQADKFAGRVMFPIHSLSGRVVAFGGRVMVKRDNIAKYINSNENELYHKSDIVYGIFQAKAEIMRKDRCYLVEGYTDVISMHQAGITNVIASCGTSLTDGQIHIVQRFTNNMTVLYDGDNAGIKAAERGINMLLNEGMNVKVLLLPNGDDPDSYARTHTADEFLSYVEANQTDFIHFKANILANKAAGDPLSRSSLITDIVHTISIVQDTVLRTLYIKDCSHILGIDEATLFNVLEKMLVDNAMKSHDEKQKQQLRQLNQEQHQRAADSANLTPEQMRTEPPATAPLVGNYSELIERRENPYIYEERELMRLFVKYIDQTFVVNRGTEKQYTTTVGDYIVTQLSIDGIQSNSDIINKLLRIYIDAPDKNAIKPDYFINQPDPEVSTFAADLIESKYENIAQHKRMKDAMAKEADMLDELVPHIVNEMRLKKVLIEIEKIKTELKNAEQNGADIETLTAITKKLMKFNELKCIYSKHTGNRTVIKAR